MRNTLIAELVVLARANGVSQEDIARKLSRPVDAVRRFEEVTDDESVYLSSIRRYCVAAGLRVNWSLLFDDENSIELSKAVTLD